MHVRAGSLLVGIGLLHQAVGVIEGWPLLTAMGRDGLIASVGTDMARNAVFWFLCTGAFMIALGGLLAWAEREARVPLPRRMGAFLVAVGLVGGGLLPVSGMWLMMIPGVLILARSRRQSAAADARVRRGDASA